jgi:cytochrome c oxidase subunit III
MPDNVFTSLFYMLTGFHGFHVLAGTIMLIVTAYRANQGHFSKNAHIGFETAA